MWDSVTNAQILIPSSQPEVLSRSRLNKEVYRIIYPFHLIFLLLCSSKYTVKYNYILKDGVLRRIVTFLSVCLVFIVSGCYMFLEKYTAYFNNVQSIKIVFLIFHAELVFFSIAAIVLFFINIVFSKQNIELILKIQLVHSNSDFSKSFKNFIIWNWIYIIIFLAINLAISSPYYITYYEQDVVDALGYLCNYLFAVFDMNVIYASRLITLLRKYLDEWSKVILKLNGGVNNRNCGQLFEIYENIMSAFQLYKTVFQVVVLSTTMNVFLRNLGFIESRLQIITDTAESVTEALVVTIVSASWLIKDIVLVILHSVQCEMFYIATEEAEISCIQLMMNKNCPGDQARLYKKVMQTNRTFSKMSACGLFYVDGVLPLKLTGLLASYVIVLLQFAFL